MIRNVVLRFVAISLAASLHAQTLTDILAAPSPGTNDIYQFSTNGNTAYTNKPDGINYYTDNNPAPGQTFTTSTNAMNLVSVAIRTAGLDHDNTGSYGNPATTPTYYLNIFSMSGSTATVLATFSAANPGFTDGDWLQWGGLSVSLATNTRVFVWQTAGQRRLCGTRGGHERLWRRRNGAHSHQRRRDYHRQQPYV